MNLIETLLATVVVTMSAAASLQLWGLAAVATAKHDRLQGLMDQVDAELMAVDLRLRQEARAVASPQDCEDAAQHLLHLALAMPAGGDVLRQVEQGGEAHQQVVVTVGAEELDQPRRRLYSPAALNLCGGVVEAEEEQAGGAGGEADGEE
jgi:hypothetical protein